MKISPQAIGKRIADLRGALGMTQRDLAALVDRSPGWVAKVESGDRSPSAPMLVALARALCTEKRALVFGTDWQPRALRPHAGGKPNRQDVRRTFARAPGPWAIVPTRRKSRQALYVDFSQTARALGSELRRRPDLDWRAVLRLNVTTPGEAFFALHVLAMPARVESWSPLELGLRVMVPSGASRNVYAGDRRVWCLRLPLEDMHVVVLPQVPFLGRSGKPYRADFMVGAVGQGRAVWLDVEIDEPYHEQQRDEDALRDEDAPFETIRIPEAQLTDPMILHRVLGELRARLSGVMG